MLGTVHMLHESDKNKMNSFHDIKQKPFRRQSILALLIQKTPQQMLKYVKKTSISLRRVGGVGQSFYS
jgi:hypothetical protein